MLDSDYLLGAAQEHQSHIKALYWQFVDKKPVILLDIQEQRIYAYPYGDFSKELSQKSQHSLKDQYEKALQDNQMVVFVRDNEKKRLTSFSLDVE
jgi:hypothetical protein